MVKERSFPLRLMIIVIILIGIALWSFVGSAYTLQDTASIATWFAVRWILQGIILMVALLFQLWLLKDYFNRIQSRSPILFLFVFFALLALNFMVVNLFMDLYLKAAIPVPSGGG